MLGGTAGPFEAGPVWHLRPDAVAGYGDRMSALTRPRGPLSARTYWTRRILVLGTALALVVGLGMTLTRFSDGSGGGGAVTPVSAGEATGGAASATSDATRPAKDKKKDKKKNKKKKPALPQPSGPCLDADVDVTPVVKDAVAGRDVTLRFRIGTKLSPACTWQASRETLTLKITSGKDLIWTSQQCPRAVPTKDLVLRREKASWLTATWSARRSDETCSRLTEWALPGWYHVAVAPLGGEPEDVQFKLSRPEPEVITAAPEPKQRKQKKDRKKTGGATASASPSGAVEPNG